MIDTARYEHKYLLTIKDYYMIKHALSPFLEQDDYSKIAQNGRYLVRSIYFDTYDLKAYQEREDGIYGRIKCRIRTYNESATQQQPLSIEIKTKTGTFTKKYSTLVPFGFYEDYIKNNCFTQSEDLVLNEFDRLVKARQLIPQIIVRYYREGYVVKTLDKVRITFDHEVKSARSNDLFDPYVIFKSHKPEYIVLEIKYADDEPEWLLGIIKKFNLKRMSNSKYLQGVAQFKPYMLR